MRPRFVIALCLSLSPALVAPRAARAQAVDETHPDGAVAQETSPEARRVAERVQAFYDQTKTFRARFKQEYLVRAHNQKKTSEGTVVFEKPGKMSFTYTEPNGNRVVSDGRTLKVYEKENAQMFEQPVDKSQYPAALAFLMGHGELQKAFGLRVLDPAAMHFEGGYVLEGTPTAPTPSYQKVLLYVDGATYQVRRVLILDAQGNRNRFDFETPVVNTPSTPGDFTFTPPPGTQVVHP